MSARISRSRARISRGELAAAAQLARGRCASACSPAGRASAASRRSSQHVAVEHPRRQRRGRARGRAGASAGASGCACARRRGRRGGRRAGARRASGPARRASGRSGSRSAARATHCGVDRVGLAVGARRGARLAISLGGTRTTRSPRGSRWRSRRPETWRQSSMAKRRSSAEAARPGEELLAAGARRCPRSRCAEAAPARRVERDGGVGLHVRVDPDYDHVRPPSVGCNRSERGPPADTP